jgi:hypothetical protein
MDEAQTISTVDWRARVSALDQGSRSGSETIRERLLKPMDGEVAKSFSEAQLRELERVLATSASRRLPVDVRITVPFLWRRYFVTFLAGPEQRSEERLKAERAKHAICTFANACFFVFLLTLSVPALIGLVHIFAAAG